MTCSMYNNGGFNCNGCLHFVKTLSITLTGTVLTLTIPAETIRNREKFCICLAQSIPNGVDANTTVNVAVTNVTAPFMLIDRCGNKIYGDQLRTRRLLHSIALTDIPAFRLIDNAGLCRTEHSFVSIVPTVPAAI